MAIKKSKELAWLKHNCEVREMEYRVSAIISTYDRFPGLVQAINSVRNQTHKNMEIIVVNDGSTDQQYDQHPFSDVVWIDLKQNTREIFGYPCPGHVRNIGISRATGGYLAFLDDDDIWFPDKTSRQLEAMAAGNFQMSCTEALYGDGQYKPDASYLLHNAERFGYRLPGIFDQALIKVNNYIIQSSVILKKDLLESAGLFKEIPLHGTIVDNQKVVEDWDLWQRCLEYTACIYLKAAFVYYDARPDLYRKMSLWPRRFKKKIKTMLTRYSFGY